MQQPEGGERDRVVVGRVALAEVAQEVLVDEVEPEEALVPPARQDVPRRGHGQEEQDSARRAHPPDAPPTASQQHEGEENPQREDDPDEPLGEHRQRHPRVEDVSPTRIDLPEIDPQEAVERHGQKERQHDLGDHDPREEVDAKPDADGQAGVQARPIPAHPAAEIINGQDQEDRAQGQRQPGRELRNAEDFVRRGHRPIHERGLLQVTDAVDVERDPVTALDDLAGRLGMRRVGVVLQRRRPGAAYVDQGRQHDEERRRAKKRFECHQPATSYQSKSRLCTYENTDDTDVTDDHGSDPRQSVPSVRSVFCPRSQYFLRPVAGFAGGFRLMW